MLQKKGVVIFFIEIPNFTEDTQSVVWINLAAQLFLLKMFLLFRQFA